MGQAREWVWDKHKTDVLRLDAWMYEARNRAVDS